MGLVTDGFTAWVEPHGNLEPNGRGKSRKRPKRGARTSPTFDSRNLGLLDAARGGHDPLAQPAADSGSPELAPCLFENEGGPLIRSDVASFDGRHTAIVPGGDYPRLNRTHPG